MTLSWMVFGAIVTLLIAAAGSAAESAARLVGRPLRWIWGAAIALTLLVVILAPFRNDPDGGAIASVALVGRAASAPTVSSGSPSFLARLIADARLPLQATLVAMHRAFSPSSNRFLLAAWILSSLLFGALFLAVHFRVRLARRGWPRAEIGGTAVCVAPSAGPAVLGIVRPEIVVPRWLLSRDVDEQRMVVTHETEHVRAGDHLLLAAGTLAVVVLPWNPAVWWMASRLRLAIELDCDARVLRRGVAPRSYGTLLIDLAEHSRGLRLGAPALVDGSSHLHTRVMAMKHETRKFARVRGGAIGLAALSLTLLACEARLPTSGEIDQMDVAGAERAATLAMAGTNAEYSVDGVSATSDQAHALRPEQIATIGVTHVAGTDGVRRNLIQITTRDTSQQVIAMETDSTAAARERQQVGTVARSRRADGGIQSRLSKGGPFTGLLLVDGVSADPSTLNTLDPKDIVSVEVLKGPAARAEYTEPRAANGVIVITTKKAPK